MGFWNWLTGKNKKVESEDKKRKEQKVKDFDEMVKKQSGDSSLRDRHHSSSQNNSTRTVKYNNATYDSSNSNLFDSYHTPLAVNSSHNHHNHNDHNHSSGSSGSSSWSSDCSSSSSYDSSSSSSSCDSGGGSCGGGSCD